jgi:hypothetical protein
VLTTTESVDVPEFVAVIEPAEQIHTNGSAPALDPSVGAAASPMTSAVPASAAEEEADSVKSLETFMENLRAGIARKTVHPSGVKVTVDMAPELFWRLKRYSRDHSNPSLRQICIEVVSAFLDEEGY